MYSLSVYHIWKGKVNNGSENIKYDGRSNRKVAAHR